MVSYARAAGTQRSCQGCASWRQQGQGWATSSSHLGAPPQTTRRPGGSDAAQPACAGNMHTNCRVCCVLSPKSCVMSSISQLIHSKLRRFPAARVAAHLSTSRPGNSLPNFRAELSMSSSDRSNTICGCLVTICNSAHKCKTRFERRLASDVLHPQPVYSRSLRVTPQLKACTEKLLRTALATPTLREISCGAQVASSPAPACRRP